MLNWNITKLTLFENPQKLIDFIKYLSTETQQSYEDLVIDTKNSAKKILRVTGIQVNKGKTRERGPLYRQRYHP